MTSEIILLRQLECPLKSFLIIGDVLLFGVQYYMAHQSRAIFIDLHLTGAVVETEATLLWVQMTTLFLQCIPS